jgi:hypothetical protein
MLRTFTVLTVGLLSAFVLTGCPEKKAEKEVPATADDPVAAAAEDKKNEEKAEEKPAAEKPAEKKKEPAAEAKDEKDEGGW